VLWAASEREGLRTDRVCRFGAGQDRPVRSTRRRRARLPQFVQRTRLEQRAFIDSAAVNGCVRQRPPGPECGLERSRTGGWNVGHRDMPYELRDVPRM